MKAEYKMSLRMNDITNMYMHINTITGLDLRMKALNYFFIICMLAASAGSVRAQNENAIIRQGNSFYRQGQFDKSLPFYQKASSLNNSNAVASYNLGDAYFRNKQLAEAGESFDRALSPSAEPAIRQKAYYNKGVALSRQQKLEESISAYKNAVILDPGDTDARLNLQKALLELKKRKPPEENKKNDEQKKKQNKKQQEGTPPPQSKLTKKQVEQLLKALQQREQQVQQKMQQKRSRSSGRPDKDW